MALKGKGCMIWKIASCENGNADAIALTAQHAGFTHVLIKIANGILPYNLDKNQVDLLPPVVQALRSKGIQVWGWHYVYGKNPIGEAQIAVKRVNQFHLDGYVIDAEHQYKEAGMENSAIAFMNELRKGIPSTPVALCSYRYPRIHHQLPWAAFLDKCDYNMPQVYWEQAHNNAGKQLAESVKQFNQLKPYRPVIPTGPLYKASGWLPTPSDIIDFMNSARTLNLEAINFFAWDYRNILYEQWDVLAQYPWPPYPPAQDISDSYIGALNTGNVDMIASLYTPDAVHITADKTIQGEKAIREWYAKFLKNTLPGAVFKLTGVNGGGANRHFTWEASSTTKKVKDGNDTIGILGNKIAYHYSFFTVS